MLGGVLSWIWGVVTSPVSWLLSILSPATDIIVNVTGLPDTVASILVLVFTIVCAVVLKRLLFPGPKNLPPGPRTLPLLGNLMDIGKTPCFAANVHEIQKKYGDLVTVYMGPTRTVFMGNHDHVKDAFIRQGSKTSNRPYMLMMEIWSDNRSNIVWGDYSPRVQMQRKLMLQALRTFSGDGGLARYEKAAFDVMSDLLEKDPKFDGIEMGYLVAFHVIVSMCFGKTFTFEDPFFKEVIAMIKEQEELMNDIGMSEMVPLLKYFPSKATKKLAVLVQKIHGYVNDAMEEHKKTFDKTKLTDYTYHLINVMDEIANDPNESSTYKTLEAKHFSIMLADLLLGATDTVRQILNWIWHYLAAYPDLQKIAQKQIDDVYGRDGEIGSECREKVPYVEAFIMEVIRLRPNTALGSMHEVTEDIELGGYNIPKGSVLMPNNWTMQRDPRYWGDDAESFRPDRWIDPDTGRYVYQSGGFIAFSMGKRSCIGETFARLQMHLLTTMLLQKYTLVPSPGHKVSVEIANHMQLKPVEQEKLMVQKR